MGEPYQVQEQFIHPSLGRGDSGTILVSTKFLPSDPCLVGGREMKTETPSNSAHIQQWLLEYDRPVLSMAG